MIFLSGWVRFGVLNRPINLNNKRERMRRELFVKGNRVGGLGGGCNKNLSKVLLEAGINCWLVFFLMEEM